jgi:hypothetical protein
MTDRHEEVDDELSEFYKKFETQIPSENEVNEMFYHLNTESVSLEDIKTFYKKFGNKITDDTLGDVFSDQSSSYHKFDIADFLLSKKRRFIENHINRVLFLKSPDEPDFELLKYYWNSGNSPNPDELIFSTLDAIEQELNETNFKYEKYLEYEKILDFLNTKVRNTNKYTRLYTKIKSLINRKKKPIEDLRTSRTGLIFANDPSQKSKFSKVPEDVTRHIASYLPLGEEDEEDYIGGLKNRNKKTKKQKNKRNKKHLSKRRKSRRVSKRSRRYTRRRQRGG